MLNKIKNILKDYLEILRESNIIGILQILFFLIFGSINFICYFFEIKGIYSIMISIIMYLITCTLIYIYSKKLLEVTNMLLIAFLSSFVGQLFIFNMTRIEIFYFCTPDVLPACSLGVIISCLAVSFSDYSLFSQLLVFLLFAICFFWWRFRISFFNIDYLIEDTSIKLENVSFTWPGFILLFNAYF